MLLNRPVLPVLGGGGVRAASPAATAAGASQAIQLNEAWLKWNGAFGPEASVGLGLIGSRSALARLDANRFAFAHQGPGGLIQIRVGDISSGAITLGTPYTTAQPNGNVGNLYPIDAGRVLLVTRAADTLFAQAQVFTVGGTAVTGAGAQTLVYGVHQTSNTPAACRLTDTVWFVGAAAAGTVRYSGQFFAVDGTAITAGTGGGAVNNVTCSDSCGFCRVDDDRVLVVGCYQPGGPSQFLGASLVTRNPGTLAFGTTGPVLSVAAEDGAISGNDLRGLHAAPMGEGRFLITHRRVNVLHVRGVILSGTTLSANVPLGLLTPATSANVFAFNAEPVRIDADTWLVAAGDRVVTLHRASVDRVFAGAVGVNPSSPLSTFLTVLSPTRAVSAHGSGNLRLIAI